MLPPMSHGASRAAVRMRRRRLVAVPSLVAVVLGQAPLAAQAAPAAASPAQPDAVAALPVDASPPIDASDASVAGAALVGYEDLVYDGTKVELAPLNLAFLLDGFVDVAEDGWSIGTVDVSFEDGATAGVEFIGTDMIVTFAGGAAHGGATIDLLACAPPGLVLVNGAPTPISDVLDTIRKETENGTPLECLEPTSRAMFALTAIAASGPFYANALVENQVDDGVASPPPCKWHCKAVALGVATALVAGCAAAIIGCATTGVWTCGAIAIPCKKVVYLCGLVAFGYLIVVQAVVDWWNTL